MDEETMHQKALQKIRPDAERLNMMCLDRTCELGEVSFLSHAMRCDTMLCHSIGLGCLFAFPSSESARQRITD